jgi:hypothetical protein
VITRDISLVTATMRGHVPAVLVATGASGAVNTGPTALPAAGRQVAGVGP